jgi:acetyl-CoA decarbonylase/synthase complex subunit gamma
MAMTGLQIHKLLPKTNCKECGSNTCLAFAMKLAQKKADLSECPYASDEAKQVLGAASQPPIRGVALGRDKQLTLGEETVLYRHEKTFVHPTALAVNVDADDPGADDALARIRDYLLERVGEEIDIDMVCVSQAGQSAADFAALARKADQTAAKPLVLRGDDADSLAQAAAAVSGAGAVLSPVTAESLDTLLPAAKEHGHALALTAEDLDSLARLAESARAQEFHNLLLELPAHGPAERFQANTIARRAALKAEYKPLGYPLIAFAHDGPQGEVGAMTEITKYGSLCVLPRFDEAMLAVLMTLRLNIYTDPQKPIQVEPGVYPIAEPGPDAPVFVTTNFSLTYFLVSGEIENAGGSAWLAVPECEGMSVLTAWAAGKFSGQMVGEFIKKSGVEDKLETRRVIVPGHVAVISGELEEALPGWEVLVGPQEAADLESFMTSRLS